MEGGKRLVREVSTLNVRHAPSTLLGNYSSSASSGSPRKRDATSQGGMIVVPAAAPTGMYVFPTRMYSILFVFS